MKWKCLICVFAVAFLSAGCKSEPAALTDAQAEIAGTIITMNKTTLENFLGAGFTVVSTDQFTGVGSIDDLTKMISDKDKYYLNMEKDGYTVRLGIRGRAYMRVAEFTVYDLQWLSNREGTPENASIRAGQRTIRAGTDREEIAAAYGEGTMSNLGGFLYSFEDGLEHEVLFNQEDIMKAYILCWWE